MTTSAKSTEEPQSLRAKERVGMVLQDKWHLDSLLGLGGMAAVYAATHRNGKRVAVKMLHAEFSHDDDVRTRFLHEGYAANKIQHDGAVSVLDDNLAPDGSAFLVMELLEGETVEQRWETRGNRLPVAEVLSIGEQVLDVLAAAHAKNVVHRDVKPENLFVTKGGVLKVLDFGIAKMFERRQSGSTTTRTGIVMGTPAFMAPEQARARWAEVDGRTDLWALGATMFTLLSGRYVHEAQSSHEQLITSATTNARALASVAPEVPAHVAALVDRALAFERADRWPDARTMQEAVRAAIEAEGTSPRNEAERGPMSGSRTLRANLADAATFIAASGTSPAVWSAERRARLAESQRLRGAIDELSLRYAAAKKRATDLQATVDTAAEERKSLELWFHRRMGRRTAAVEQAREEVRRQALMVGRRALLDRDNFGGDIDGARAQIATLERAAEAAARDVAVHKLALRAYHGPSLRIGVVTLACAAALALALLAAPIVWRATRVVIPVLPKTTESR